MFWTVFGENLLLFLMYGSFVNVLYIYKDFFNWINILVIQMCSELGWIILIWVGCSLIFIGYVKTFSLNMAMFFSKTKKKFCSKVLYRIPSFGKGDKEKKEEIVIQTPGKCGCNFFFFFYHIHYNTDYGEGSFSDCNWKDNCWLLYI